jgi:leucyl aminopeptidase (aminopeptidase T)
MADPSEQLAHRVLAENLRVRKGETVLIESWTHSLPYARAFVREARRLGARPTVLYEDEAAYWDAVSSKNYAPWADLSKTERAAVQNADVYVYFWGPADRPRLDRMPAAVQDKVTAYNDEWYKIAGKAGLRGVRMNLGMASDENAKTFGLKGPSWRAQVLRAGAVDAKTLLQKGQRVAKAIEGGRELRIHHSNGTDLTIQLGKVHTRVDAGLVDPAAMKRPFGMMTNNPSGQVFAAIDGGHAEGTVVSNRGVYLNNVLYDGIKWTLSDGRLAARSIGAGRATFEKAYAKAPKGKDQLGLVSIGLNPAGKGLFPNEDCEEGAALLGVGNNGFLGGLIRIPFQGYTMVGDTDIEVDGTPIVRSGRVL